jgi:hypothetical protein
MHRDYFFRVRLITIVGSRYVRVRRLECIESTGLPAAGRILPIDN